jgi:hypothetical protein
MRIQTVPAIVAILLFLRPCIGRVHAAPVYDHDAGTWIDDYSDSAGLSSMDQVGVDPSDGRLKLTNSSGGFTPPFNTSGTAITTTIIPLSVAQWGSVAGSGSGLDFHPETA